MSGLTSIQSCLSRKSSVLTITFPSYVFERWHIVKPHNGTFHFFPDYPPCGWDDSYRLNFGTWFSVPTGREIKYLIHREGSEYKVIKAVPFSIEIWRFWNLDDLDLEPLYKRKNGKTVLRRHLAFPWLIPLEICADTQFQKKLKIPAFKRPRFGTADCTWY